MGRYQTRKSPAKPMQGQTLMGRVPWRPLVITEGWSFPGAAIPWSSLPGVLNVPSMQLP